MKKRQLFFVLILATLLFIRKMQTDARDAARFATLKPIPAERTIERVPTATPMISGRIASGDSRAKLERSEWQADAEGGANKR